MKTVAIVGVGLIGGSFGLALRAAGFKGEILGVSSAAAVAAGITRGAISADATLAKRRRGPISSTLHNRSIEFFETLDSLARDRTARLPDYGRRQHQNADRAAVPQGFIFF